MSQILSRHFKIILAPDKYLSVPRAQVLAIQFGHDAAKHFDTIEIRLSLGRITLTGTGLTGFWEELASGMHAELELDKELDPGRITGFATNLESEFLKKRQNKSAETNPPAGGGAGEGQP